ncbi:DMT family transporter [Lutibacter citreus]|uniref:DMT family transporter n=1 Tax=Lutibacter citreus TaxID=2138210 RepID=UPI000DBE2CD7|nr:DMT family transporter [Lutibacter citreus]
MINSHLKNIFEVNLSILFICSSGVLGRSINLPPENIIWWRCFLGAIFLGIYCWYKKDSLKITSKKDAISLFTSGLFLGAHWVTYFYALQLSNVALGMLSLFTYPVITAVLEPLFFNIRFNKNHIILSGLVMVGIYFLTPEMDFENENTKGIIVGVISAILFALRNILTKRNLHHFKAPKVMFYQMLVAVLFIAPLLHGEGLPKVNDMGKLLFLGLFTTAIGHSLFVNSFKNFSISTVSIISSMSPIYGIILGMIFLQEIPGGNTVIGGVLILVTVIIESIQSRNK